MYHTYYVTVKNYITSIQTIEKNNMIHCGGNLREFEIR